MSPLDDIRDDLDPDLGPSEAEAQAGLAERLRSQAPAPAEAFRAGLRRRLLEGERRERSPYPAGRLRVVVAAYVSCGAALLAFATASVAGLGPLAG
jgi:hypothetical protein